MAYSAEVIQRARERLAQAREDRESENRQHLAEAYRRVPRLRELDTESLEIALAHNHATEQMLWDIFYLSL